MASRAHDTIAKRIYSLYMWLAKNKRSKILVLFFVLIIILIIPYVLSYFSSKNFYKPERPEISFYPKERMEFRTNETHEIISYKSLYFFVDNEEIPEFTLGGFFYFSDVNIEDIKSIKGWCKIDEKSFDVKVKIIIFPPLGGAIFAIELEIPKLSMKSGQKLELGYSFEIQCREGSVHESGGGIVWSFYEEENPLYKWPLGLFDIVDFYPSNLMPLEEIDPESVNLIFSEVLRQIYIEENHYSRFISIKTPENKQEIKFIYSPLDNHLQSENLQEEMGCLIDSIEVDLKIQEEYYLVRLSMHATNPSKDPAYMVLDPFTYFFHFKEKPKVINIKTEEGSSLYSLREKKDNRVIETYQRMDGLPILQQSENTRIFVEALVLHDHNIEIEHQILYPKFMVFVPGENTQIRFGIEVPENLKIFEGYPSNYVRERERKIYWSLVDFESGDILYFACTFGKDPSLPKNLWISNTLNIYLMLALWAIVVVVCSYFHDHLGWIFGMVLAHFFFSWEFFYSKVIRSEIIYIEDKSTRFLLHSLYWVPIIYIIGLIVMLILLKWSRSPLKIGKEREFQIKYDIFLKVIKDKQELKLKTLKTNGFLTSRQIKEILEELSSFLFDKKWTEVFVIQNGRLKLIENNQMKDEEVKNNTPKNTEK
jgi:hypothetical protein